jgi:hypothetical protein
MSDEPGEASDTATPEECEIASPEGSPDAEDEFHPFDEVYDAYQPGPALRSMGPDGLVQTIDTTSESDIPALSTESLVCMGDYSKFVVRTHWGDIVATFEPLEVERAPDGRWRIKLERAMALSKLVIAQRRKVLGQLLKTIDAPTVNANVSDASDLQVFLGMMQAPGSPDRVMDAFWLPVEPIRPQCRHYVRQKGTFHLNAAHKKYYRLCAARRTTEGTFMTVSDSGMYACDMREPYDVASAALIDDFDQLKIAQGAKREHLPIFQTNGIFDDAQKRKET